jgi:nucleoside-diphosphate kinase
MSTAQSERTLVIVKPDGVARGLVGQVISRFEATGFWLIAMRCTTLSDELAREFYAEHKGKDFFEPLIAFMTSGPVVLLALERDQAISRARQLCGKTNPLEAAPGSLRADYGLDGRRNTVHASDSPASARRELGLMLPEAVEP